jgi:hypothetical protein
MNPEFDSKAGGGARFHATRWTLVMPTMQSEIEEAEFDGKILALSDSLIAAEDRIVP